MDTRNRNLYETTEAAIAAGVPEQLLENVNVETIANGPFKGRKYVIEKSGPRRLGRRVQNAPRVTK